MAQNLFHLGVLWDDQKLKNLAETMTISLSHLITSEPNYMSNWGIAYTEIKKGMAEVAVVGTVSKAARKELRLQLGAR